MPSPRSARPHSKVADPSSGISVRSTASSLAGETRGDRGAPPVISACTAVARPATPGTPRRWPSPAPAFARSRSISEATARAIGRKLPATGSMLSQKTPRPSQSLPMPPGARRRVARRARGFARGGLGDRAVAVRAGPGRHRAGLELPGVCRIVGFMTAHPDGFASLEEAAEAVSAYLPHRPRPNDLGGSRKICERAKMAAIAGTGTRAG